MIGLIRSGAGARTRRPRRGADAAGGAPCAAQHVRRRHRDAFGAGGLGLLRRRRRAAAAAAKASASATSAASVRRRRPAPGRASASGPDASAAAPAPKPPRSCARRHDSERSPPARGHPAHRAPELRALPPLLRERPAEQPEPAGSRDGEVRHRPHRRGRHDGRRRERPARPGRRRVRRPRLREPVLPAARGRASSRSSTRSRSAPATLAGAPRRRPTPGRRARVGRALGAPVRRRGGSAVRRPARPLARAARRRVVRGGRPRRVPQRARRVRGALVARAVHAARDDGGSSPDGARARGAVARAARQSGRRRRRLSRHRGARADGCGPQGAARRAGAAERRPAICSQGWWRRRRRPPTAFALLHAAALKWPDDLELALRVLDAYEDASDDAGGRAWARRMRHRADATAHVFTNVGEYYLRLSHRESGAAADRDADEARRTFGELVEFAPEDPVARRRLGDLLRAHGWYDEAFRQYETLAQLTPDDPAVPLLLAAAAQGMGRIEEAVSWAEKAASAGSPDGTSPVSRAARATASAFLAWARDEAARARHQDEVDRLRARAHRRRGRRRRAAGERSLPGDLGAPRAASGALDDGARRADARGRQLPALRRGRGRAARRDPIRRSSCGSIRTTRRAPRVSAPPPSSRRSCPRGPPTRRSSGSTWASATRRTGRSPGSGCSLQGGSLRVEVP